MLDFSVTFIITIINIAVLFLILRAVLFKPVTKFMAERALKVQRSIDQAEEDKAAAKKLLAQHDAQLKAAGTEAEKIIRAAREQAEAEAGRILAESRAETERISAAARARLESERLTAMAIFKAEAAAMVVNAAGRLIRRELAGAEQQRYAAEALEQIAAGAPRP
ncbi:MAG: ATP synthase F0 subunit B [Spirochaetaceae bacterium]|jgi:F-type H+-transporting ATPase subunit b|nr:ATP synthase F0 subunit B [Spirochaetaceae bacterium]